MSTIPHSSILSRLIAARRRLNAHGVFMTSDGDTASQQDQPKKSKNNTIQSSYLILFFKPNQNLIRDRLRLLSMQKMTRFFDQLKFIF